MKKSFLGMVLALGMGMLAGSASADWLSPSNIEVKTGQTSRVEIPGGYSLQEAHAICQTKLKTGGYQECMAGKRGMYTVNADGNPHENFVRSEKQVLPERPAGCGAELVITGSHASWKILAGSCSVN